MKIMNNNAEENIIKEFKNISLEELIKIYGDIPMKSMKKPGDYGLNSSVDSSLNEDSEVIINEINNKNI